MNQRRLDLIEIIGGMECKKCHNNDERVLQIDHIYGNGKEMSLQKSENLEWYIFNPDIAYEELQVLCANCHIIKTIEMGDRYKHRVKTIPSLDLGFIDLDKQTDQVKEKVRCYLMKEYLENGGTK